MRAGRQKQTNKRFWGAGTRRTTPRSPALRSLPPQICVPTGYFTFWVILSITWGLLATVVSTVLPLWEARESIWLITKNLFTCAAPTPDEEHDGTTVVPGDFAKQVRARGGGQAWRLWGCRDVDAAALQCARAADARRPRLDPPPFAGLPRPLVRQPQGPRHRPLCGRGQQGLRLSATRATRRWLAPAKA